MLSDVSLTVDTLSDLSDVPSDVTALFLTAEVTDLQLGLDWFRNFVRTVAAEPADSELLVLRRGGVAVAALPLLVERAVGGIKVRSMGNYYSTLFAIPCAADLNAHELAHLLVHLRRRHQPLQALTLAPLDPALSQTQTLREALRLAGYLPYDYACFANWYLPVRGSAQDYLAGRPGELRSTLRRMGKKFAAAGGLLEVKETLTPEDVAAFVAVYNASWKRPEPYPDFMPGLMRLCAEKRCLRLGLARMGDSTVAAQLWMVAGGKASIYKLAYDPAFKQFSPGSLLTARLMEHVIDVDKVCEIDYLSGDDAYKKAWVSHRRERVGVVAYNPRSLSGLLGLARHWMGHGRRQMLARLQQVRRSQSP